MSRRLVPAAAPPTIDRSPPTVMIHLLATGGTIAMQRSPAAGGNVPALGAAELVARVGGFDGGRELTVEDWERLPGVHRGPAELWALRQRVAELVAGPAAPSGVVITHGTDTLEETAYLLARTIPPRVPVVVTGAMRTSSDPDWDGPRNLRDAVRVAGHPESRDRGTLVVFAGRIIDARFVVKVDSFQPDAFGSPHAPELGTVDDDGVDFECSSPPHTLLPARKLAARVGIVPLILGDDGRLLEAARELFDGVVIVGFGRGNIPPGALPALRRWLDAGKPVVLASRCASGEVGGDYAFEGGGGELLRMGVIPAGARPVSLARMELTLSISAGVPYGGNGT
ncbi:MAG TPA: asparaginase [Gemmatimonadales bacterium]